MRLPSAGHAPARLRRRGPRSFAARSCRRARNSSTLPIPPQGDGPSEAGPTSSLEFTDLTILHVNVRGYHCRRLELEARIALLPNPLRSGLSRRRSLTRERLHFSRITLSLRVETATGMVEVLLFSPYEVMLPQLRHSLSRSARSGCGSLHIAIVAHCWLASGSTLLRTMNVLLFFISMMSGLG